MADNKDKKVLNVSDKREQNDACISSAEREEQVTKAQPKGNVPALRFPEFTGEWSVKSISDLANVIGGGTPDTTIKSYWNGNIQWFTPSEIGKTKYVELSLRTITLEGLNNSNAKLLPPYTILLSSRATVGECSIALQECATNQGFQSLIAKNCDIDFLYYLIQTKKKDLIRKACGSTFLEISANEIRKIHTNVPSNAEQKKIGALLSLIDKRIETQNKIIEKLATLIKGIIETVISSQKPNTLIKNCLECNSSTLQESQVAETGTFPVYGATGISGYTETADINGESILIIKDGSSVGIVKFVTGEYSYIGTLNSLIAKDGYCLKYIYFALQRFSFEPYKTGMAIPHIYFKDYGKAKIYCPSLSLQTLIAQKLSLIENKMEVEKRIILCYQLQKSYLLSRMFI